MMTRKMKSVRPKSTLNDEGCARSAAGIKGATISLDT